MMTKIMYLFFFFFRGRFVRFCICLATPNRQASLLCHRGKYTPVSDDSYSTACSLSYSGFLHRITNTTTPPKFHHYHESRIVIPFASCSGELPPHILTIPSRSRLRHSRKFRSLSPS